MPAAPESPLAPGTSAPDFSLPDVISGQVVGLRALLATGVGAVLDFWSTECPWSRYYDDYFLERAAQWQAQGVTLLMVNSNANESLEQMRDMADAYGIANPILHDAGNRVADAFGAVTTPHLFVIDRAGIIIYQGAVDDRSFRQQTPTVNYLDAAVEALVAGRAPDPTQSPAYGCTIVRG